MEQIISEIQEDLFAKEQEIPFLVNDYREGIARRETLRHGLEMSSQNCRMKQRHFGILRKRLNENVQLSRTKMEVAHSQRYERTLSKLDQCAGVFSKTLDKVTRLEQIAPNVFDDRSLKEELDRAQEKAEQLERECRQKRTMVHKGAREKMAHLHSVMQMAQMVTDVLWEFSELKKDEEEAELATYNCNLSLGRKIAHLKKKVQNRHSLQIFK